MSKAAIDPTKEQREKAFATAIDEIRRRQRRRRWRRFTRQARRMWGRVPFGSYWLVASVLAVVLTWKLLTSGDFLLLALGLAFAIALSLGASFVIAGVVAYAAVRKFWPDIQKTAESAMKHPPYVKPGAISAKPEGCAPPERIH